MMVTPFSAQLQLKPESRWPLKLSDSTIRSVLNKPISEVARKPLGNLRSTDTPATSIVIVCFDNLVLNRLCLETVLASTEQDSVEIIVVDNGSTDGTVEFLMELARFDIRVRVLLNEGNRGFAAACNQGLSAARGDTLVVLNNDTLVPPNWLARLVNRLEDPNIGLVGPVTNRAGNEAQIETDYSTFGEFLDFAERRSLEYDRIDLELPMLTMFCAAFRRDVFESVGELDERFEVGLFEDEDYCVRLINAGYRLVCAEDVFIHHFGQASIGKLAARGEYGEIFHINRKKFEEKWGVKWIPHRSRPNQGYQELVKRIRTILEATLPQSAFVLVVSKGDEDLLSLSGRTALHFPSGPDGLYSGHHPRNSAEAIDHLEEFRNEGSQFLVIPAPMFWWLEYYSQFAEHLARNYRCIEYEDICLVYQLTDHEVNSSKAELSLCNFTKGIDRLHARLVTVVVPVFGKFSDLRPWLEQFLQSGIHQHRVLLIAVPGTDERTIPALEDIVSRFNHVALAVTARTMEFVAAFNIGIRLAPGDIAVTGPGVIGLSDWLEQMDARAASHEMVATVSQCSAKPGDEVIASHMGSIYPRYSLFISRAALRRVGALAEEHSADIHGALTDFNSRAANKGFLNLDVEEICSRPETPSGQPRILIIVHSCSGGTRFATDDLASAISQHYRCYVLKAALSSWELYEVADGRLAMLRRYRFSANWRLDAALDVERELVLKDISVRFRVDLVNIQHFLCTGPDIVHRLKELDLPVVVSFNDYYALCPTAHLLDDSGRFCGGVCTPGFGACPVDKTFIRDLAPRLKHDFVYSHRQTMDATLAHCDAVTAPSYSTMDRLGKFLKSVRSGKFRVFDLGCDMPRRTLAKKPCRGIAVRVVCLGNLNKAKGLHLITKLMRLNMARGRPFEFHFLGQQSETFRLEELGGVAHGSYRREEFLERLAEIRPSFSLIAPICEETFSYTLSESWAAGLPVFASNRGALRERIEKHGGGWLFDPENPDAFFCGMVDILNSPESWNQESKRIQQIDLVSTHEQAMHMMQLFQLCLESRNFQGIATS